MHFMLGLLFCSLIRVSVSKEKYVRDVHPATEDDVKALREGQIVGVEPINFLQPCGRSPIIHPVVFVDIRSSDGVAQVVAISSSFKNFSVPPHLRENVTFYFLEGTTTNALGRGKVELKGDLDLSAYREVKPEHILIDNSGDRTIMNETNFAKMMAKIEFNSANRWRIPPFVPKGEGSKKLASATPFTGRKEDLNSVEEGEVIHIKLNPELKARHKRVETRLAIFVCWTGYDDSLAIVSISGGNNNAHAKRPAIVDYKFRPDNMVKGAHGKFAPISGVIGHDYEIVPAKDAIYDWDDKRVMTYESYQKLRNEIDSNRGEKGKNGGKTGEGGEGGGTNGGTNGGKNGGEGGKNKNGGKNGDGEKGGENDGKTGDKNRRKKREGGNGGKNGGKKPDKAK